jgi:hypothetical protein
MYQFSFTAVALVLFGGFLLFARGLLPPRGFSWALVAWGGGILLFHVFGLAGRACLVVAGEIVSAETHCVQPYNNRCVTTYELIAASGTRTVYRAASNDQALARNLAAGSRIDKRPWRLDYTVDGTGVHDFPWAPYVAFSIVGAAMMAYGGARLHSGRRAKPR